MYLLVILVSAETLTDAMGKSLAAIAIVDVVETPIKFAGASGAIRFTKYLESKKRLKLHIHVAFLFLYI